MKLNLEELRSQMKAMVDQQAAMEKELQNLKEENQALRATSPPMLEQLVQTLEQALQAAQASKSADGSANMKVKDRNAPDPLKLQQEQQQQHHQWWQQQQHQQPQAQRQSRWYGVHSGGEVTARTQIAPCPMPGNQGQRRQGSGQSLGDWRRLGGRTSTVRGAHHRAHSGYQQQQVNHQQVQSYRVSPAHRALLQQKREQDRGGRNRPEIEKPGGQPRRQMNMKVECLSTLEWRQQQPLLEPSPKLEHPQSENDQGEKGKGKGKDKKGKGKEGKSANNLEEEEEPQDEPESTAALELSPLEVESPMKGGSVRSSLITREKTVSLDWNTCWGKTSSRSPTTSCRSGTLYALAEKASKGSPVGDLTPLEKSCPPPTWTARGG